MKKVLYTLVLPLVLISGLVIANREIKPGSPKPASTKPLSTAEINTEREKWEATPAGSKYKEWTVSPEGAKVLANSAKIMKYADASIEAVVTSLTLPPGSRLGFGLMARIDGDDYILTFDPEKSQLGQLKTLEVDDKIIIRSRTVSHAPKYAYPIIRTDYTERDGKIIFKRIPRKDGC